VALRDEVLHIVEPLRVSMEQSVAAPLTDYLSTGATADLYELQGGMNRGQQTLNRERFVSHVDGYLNGGNNLISVISIRAANEKDVEVDMLLRQFDRGVLQRILNRAANQTNLLDEQIMVRKVISTFKFQRTGSEWTVTDVQWRSRLIDFNDEALWPRILSALGRP